MTAKRGDGGGNAPKARARRKSRRKRGRKPAAPLQSDALEQSAAGLEEDGAEDEPTELGIGSRMVPPLAQGGADRGEPGAGEVEEIDPSSAAHGGEVQDVEEQIRALEARLDGMIRRASKADGDEAPPSIREQVGFAAREVVERLAADRPGSDDSSVVDSARELLSSDYYLRQWGRLGMRNRSEQVDEFGLDPTYEARLRPLAEFLYKRYFRVETRGAEHIPAEGRCIVVSNHSGTLPLDGLMLKTAVRLEHPSARELRWLAEDFIFYLPFVGAFMNRVGAVRACQENAERLLRHGSLVAVFPEGVKGIKKLYRERYRLQRFGRGGFIRLCLRTQTPLVPAAVIGAEEASPMLYRIEYLSKALGLPYIPITPTFPALGPLGLLPAPSKWRITFGEPLHFDGYGPEAADDHVLVGRLADRVRSSIQRLIDDGLRQRKNVWFG